MSEFVCYNKSKMGNLLESGGIFWTIQTKKKGEIRAQKGKKAPVGVNIRAPFT